VVSPAGVAEAGWVTSEGGSVTLSWSGQTPSSLATAWRLARRSGPAEIYFAEGVRAVGFNAQTQLLGFETLTFSLFNDLELLGTFSVSRMSSAPTPSSDELERSPSSGSRVCRRVTRMAAGGLCPVLPLPTFMDVTTTKGCAE
jgi:hypothetical protein